MCASAQVCVYLTGINAAAGKQLYFKKSLFMVIPKGWTGTGQKVRNNGLMSFL